MQGQSKGDEGLCPGRLYRYRPTMAYANIINGYLVDLEGLNLQFFNLKDFTLHKRVEVISQEDKYGAQLNVFSNKVLIIFGVSRFMLFHTSNMSVVETVEINHYIEKFEVRNGYLTILTADEEDSENKLIHCWKIDQ